MARPKKEGLDYFAHECDASTDDKIETLEAVYGNDGYAMYFKLLERIYRNKGKLFISDPETMKKYADKCRIFDTQKFEKMIEFMCHIKLFKKSIWNSTKCLTSNGILKRVQFVVNKRDKDNSRKKKDVFQQFSDGKPVEPFNSIKAKQSKAKQSKENETPQEIHQIDIRNTMDEDIKNFKTIGMTEEWIKNNLINQGISEAEIDLAMGKKF